MVKNNNHKKDFNEDKFAPTIYEKLIELRTKAIKGSEEDLKIYTDYCMECLNNLLRENQEVLKRLKEK